MHQKTIECVEKANRLIEQSDEDSLRYACLQLRMGIEHLFYEMIPLYSVELPIDIITKWQPKQILDALIDCDPAVQHDTKVAIVDKNEDGSVGSPLISREQKAVTKRLLKDHYHRLGFFLHAPMDQANVNLAKFQSDLRSAAEALRAYGKEKVLCNLGLLVTFKCDCGRSINRKVAALEAKQRVTCPDPICGAMFDSLKDGSGNWTFKLVESSYACPVCNNVNIFGTHLATDGREFSCNSCHAKVRLRSAFKLETTTNDSNQS